VWLLWFCESPVPTCNRAHGQKGGRRFYEVPFSAGDALCELEVRMWRLSDAKKAKESAPVGEGRVQGVREGH